MADSRLIAIALTLIWALIGSVTAGTQASATVVRAPVVTSDASQSVDELLKVGFSLKEGLKKVGKEIKRGERNLKALPKKVEAEVRRAREHARKIEAEVRRAREKAQKIEREIRRVRNQIIDLPKKLEDEVRRVRNRTKEEYNRAKQDLNNVEVGFEQIKKIAKDARGALSGESGLVRKSLRGAGKYLGAKLVNAINGAKLNEYLDTELFGDIRLIDVLMPIRAGLEHIDPTGLQKCIRHKTTAKSIEEVAAALQGRQVDTTEEAAQVIVTSCVYEQFLADEQAGTPTVSDDELEEIDAERARHLDELNRTEARAVELKRAKAAMQEEKEDMEKMIRKIVRLEKKSDVLIEQKRELERKLDETFGEIEDIAREISA